MSTSLSWLRVLLEKLPEATGLPRKSPEESLYNPKAFRQRLLDKTHYPYPTDSLKNNFLHEFRSLMQMEQGQDPSFLEQGPGLICVVDILEEAFTLFPDDISALNDMVQEISETAAGYYTDVGVQVSVHFPGGKKRTF